VDQNKNTKPGGGSPRKKNPLGSIGAMVPHMVPIVAGGGVGVLEATQPSWWAKLSDGARVILFGAVAAVALKMKQPAVCASAETLSAFYLGRVVGVMYLEKGAEKGADKNAAGKAALKGLLDGIDDVAGPETEEARRQFLAEVDRLQRQNGVAGLVEVDDVSIGEVVERIGAGYGIEQDEINGLTYDVQGWNTTSSWNND
jgi:hypothetical protein